MSPAWLPDEPAIAHLNRYHELDKKPPMVKWAAMTSFAFVICILELGEPWPAWKLYRETIRGVPEIGPSMTKNEWNTWLFDRKATA